MSDNEINNEIPEDETPEIINRQHGTSIQRLVTGIAMIILVSCLLGQALAFFSTGAATKLIIAGCLITLVMYVRHRIHTGPIKRYRK